MTTDLCPLSGVKNGDKAQKTVTITSTETTIHVDAGTLIMRDFSNTMRQRTAVSSTAITIKLHTKAECLYNNPRSILKQKIPATDNICAQNHLLSMSLEAAGCPLITL